MILMERLLSASTVSLLGWTILHSLWELTLAALVLAVVLRVLHGRSASCRYLVSCAGLLVMVLAPVVTICVLAQPAAVIDVADQPSVVKPSDSAAVVAVPESVAADRPVTVPAAVSPDEPLPPPPVPWSQRARLALEQRLAWVVAIWLTGVAILSLRLCLQWLWAQRAKSRQARPVADHWQARLGELAGRVGLSRSVRLLESALARVPLVIGHLRPVILLPACALTGLTPGQLEAILIHELAHIRRYDYLVNLVQTIIETLLFYHPAVWYVSRRIRVERENCCDDSAVAVTGDRLAYARALLAMEELRQVTPAFALAAGGSGLLARIRRLVDTAPPLSSRSVRPFTGSLLLAVLLMLLIGLKLFATASHEPKTATQPGLVFGPVIERQVSRSDKNNIVDLDTGTLLSFPESFMESIARAGSRMRIPAILKRFGEKTGADAWADGDKFLGIQMAIAPIPNAEWDKYTPDQVYNFMDISEGSMPAFLFMPNMKNPASYIFKTREGGMGLIQVSNVGPAFKIRYKMTQVGLPKEFPSSHPATVPSAVPQATTKPVGQKPKANTQHPASDIEHPTKEKMVGQGPPYTTTSAPATQPAGQGPEHERLIQQEKLNKINQLFAEAIRLRHEHKYEEAIRKVKQVLVIEPALDRAKWFIKDTQDLAEYARKELIRHVSPFAPDQAPPADERTTQSYLVGSPNPAPSSPPAMRPAGQKTKTNIEHSTSDTKHRTEEGTGKQGQGGDLPANMVGTWFFANPDGDNEQMSIYPDGRIVMFFSNGYRGQSRYEGGSPWPGHSGIMPKLELMNGDLVLYSPLHYGTKPRIWFRIDPRPSEEVRLPLTWRPGQRVVRLGLTLRADKVKWPVGGSPSLHVDFRNEGTVPLAIKPAPDGLHLVVDGKYYLPTCDTIAWPWPLNPGAQFHDLKIDLNARNWRLAEMAAKPFAWSSSSRSDALVLYLKLGPGKHFVRVVDAVGTMASSNTVEIEMIEDRAAATSPATQPTGQKSVDVDRYGGNALVRAAEMTYAKFIRRGGNPDGSGIAPEFWAEPIRELKPLYVYTHRVNLVVVLKKTDQVEEGLYIYLPISSYIPRSGVDGFILTDGKDGVYRFKRYHFPGTRTSPHRPDPPRDRRARSPRGTMDAQPPLNPTFNIRHPILNVERQSIRWVEPPYRWRCRTTSWLLSGIRPGR